MIYACTFAWYFTSNWYFASCGSLAYKLILSISGGWLIKLNYEFVFPDSEPLIINILYGRSGICDQFGLCFFMFSFPTSSKIIIFYLFIKPLHLISPFSLTRSLFHIAYVSIKSIDCILLWTFELKAILLISSVKTL